MQDSHPTRGLRAPMQPRHRRRRFASIRTIGALVLREMSSTYGKSAAGYLWAVAEPVASIALLSAVFSVAFFAPAIGINFPLFYATGMLPFIAFTDVSGKVATALLFSKALLAYPSVTFVDAIVARFVLNFLTEIMVAYIVFTGILVLFETRVIIDIPSIAYAFALTGALALGMGTLNCYLFTRFPVWQRTWSIIMRPMFILACVLFPYETIPLPYRDYLWFNPLVHIVGLVRGGFYRTYDDSYASPVYVLVWSGLALVMGLLLLRRFHSDLLDR